MVGCGRWERARREPARGSQGSRFGGSVTPDGRTVVFQETGSSSNGIRAMAFDSTQVSPGRLSRGPSVNPRPSLSPDGHWLAYQSDQTGQMEVYVQLLSGARCPRFGVAAGRQGASVGAQWQGAVLSLGGQFDGRVGNSVARLSRSLGAVACSAARFWAAEVHLAYRIAPDCT